MTFVWLKDLLDARAQRERWLIVFTLMVLIYVIIHALALSPLLDKLKTEQKQLETQQQAALDLKERDYQSKQLSKNNQEHLSLKLEALKSSIEQHKTLVQSSLMGENVIEVMAALLQDSPRVQALGHHSSTPVPEYEHLYHHRIELTLQGEYLDIVAFVKTIEQLPVPIAIDYFHYQVTEHPKADVRLRLGFLSSSSDLVRLTP